MILFQDKVVDIVDSFTMDNLPHTILIRGEYGSGKHLLAHRIAQRFNFSLIDITDNLNQDTINEIYVSTTVNFYIINSDKISIKDQNTILKFLEEPCVNAYIILLNSTGLLLDTIQNRCFELTMGIYDKNMLETFSFDSPYSDLILEIARTPGQATDYVNEDFKGMYDFAQLIFQHIRTANLSNCLTITRRIAFKGPEKDKFNVDTFVRILLHIASKLDTDIYMFTDKLCNDLAIPNVNKQLVFESYILNLKYRTQHHE